MSVTVVTVAYNSAGTLAECYVTAASDSVDVVLVDNGSDDDVRPAAQRLGATLVRSELNLGFGRGCNLGVENAPTRRDWVAFVNPDLTIEASDLIRIVEDAPADAAAVAPRIVGHSGDDLGDVARVSPTWPELALSWLLGRRAPLRQVEGTPGQRHQPVDVTSGACLIVRRDAFDAVGGFPQWLFFNSEDVWLCDRLRAHGRVYVDHGASARHKKLSSSRGVTYDQILAETARAESAYAADRYPTPAWFAVYLSIMLGVLVRAVPMKGLRRFVKPLTSRLWHEAAAIRHGHPEPAGAVFVGWPATREA